MMRPTLLLLSARAFDEIPGPKSYPIVGTLLNYLPVVGRYRFDALHVNGRKNFLEFGPVVREEIVPGTNIVWIFEPDDIRELLRREGRHPQRRSHLALDHYRRSKPEVYNTGGLLPTNGEEWYKLRSAFQKGLSSPQAVRRYLPVVNEVIDDFIEYIRRQNPRGDFLPHLSRVFLEMLALVAFDHRLGSFSDKEMNINSRSSRLVKAAATINSCILKTDNGLQMWRHFETPIYRRLRKAHECLDRTAMELIREKQQKMKIGEGKDHSILENYLSEVELEPKDVVGMSADMLLAGVDTTTYSTGFVLYHLAKDPEKQRILAEEGRRLLPDHKSEITAEILNGSHYLKAAVKESFRLNPISIGIGRILQEDAIFSGYQVPKGTVVVTQNQVASRFECYFREPNEFIPERWLKDGGDVINPYLVLPFGHGPRSCIARRLAEQNIQALVLKLLRRFEIIWNGGRLDSTSQLINKPNGSLLFTFVQRPTT